MRTNRYPGTCVYCHNRVASFAGKMWRDGSGGRWLVAHLACAEYGEDAVVATHFSDGTVTYRNRKGRCEDAPCCGCCS